MHMPKISAATALALTLALVPLEAAPKSGKGSAPVKVSTKAPKATTKKTTGKAPTTTKAATKVTKPPKTTTTTASSATKTRGPKTTTGKVGDRLSRNTKLRTKLESQLAALGYTGSAYEAGYGFKNFGQFNAAVQNAQNQGISFEALKTQMTGMSVTTDPITGAPVVMKANLNPDGTVTMVPADEVTNPAPTQSLGQAKKTLGVTVEEAGTTLTTTPTTSTTPGTN